MLNVAYINIKVPSEQKAFESALEKALEIVQNQKDISPEKIKELDDEIIAAFDKFAVFNKLRVD